jgi:hypothetical protein
MAELIFVVSRTARQTYLHLKHTFADESRLVVLDRRTGERRRSQRPLSAERRHSDRRHQDVRAELQSSGWAVVRRVGDPMTSDATRCVEPGCQEEGAAGLNGAWLCLMHFDIRFAAMQATLGRGSPRAST